MDSESKTILKLFLEEFINCDELNLEPTEEHIELYKTSLLVNEHIDSYTSYEQFKFIVEKEQLQNRLTPVLISDFNQDDEMKMILEVEKFEGVYHSKICAPNPIRNGFNTEDNTFYVVFSDPIRAFSFVKNINEL